MATAPESVRIRNYDVGFGDCFLLTFRYAGDKERHVLIDFGSFPKPKRSNAGDMVAIAKHIKKTCKDKLHAVVATHRHADHINGFATKNGAASGDIIRALAPDVVIQPWTEHPQLATQATGLGQFGAADQQHVTALRDVEKFFQSVVTFAAAPPPGWSKSMKAELGFLGQLGIRNKSAVENLMTMAGTKNGQKYVRFGTAAGLSKVLPGVKVRVIGPPTIQQLKGVEKQRRTDTTEFWHILAATRPTAPAPRRHQGPFSNRHALSHIPGYARWLKDHADALLRQQLMGIVRRMDGVLNNTSVILLFEVGNKKLLFPGDAQIENWSFALGQKPIQKLLAGVDVYKVGHHGSLNATPKASLWGKFTKKGKGLRTLLSTESGHHGDTEKTAVPRSTLVDELESQSRLLTTNLPAKDRKDPKIVKREQTVSWVEETIRL